MTIELVYGYLGGLLVSRTSSVRFYIVQAQSLRQVRLQSLEVALGFLNLGQSRGTAGFGQQVDRKLVGRCTPHKVWEVGELERRALHLCYFSIGDSVCCLLSGGVCRGRELAGQFCKKSPGLLDGG